VWIFVCLKQRRGGKSVPLNATRATELREFLDQICLRVPRALHKKMPGARPGINAAMKISS
jgi:hypothetical protein